ncbi:uncharacterized protein BDW43DRAFT_274754 [Aspergillus alliaceus]|uniref:uncharacterized protein n=1 Tax=Petromyces alliaceus TaxID=209559 RepID=UPI0012A3B9BE|nr:uncharacterized protein BDW43DRAFT_274754 [Aspergillus alliaceus]KAB8233978.1 hypothetical protein BDW43DRAFT_274754 [Aspergillus alliaceus]
MRRREIHQTISSRNGPPVPNLRDEHRSWGNFCTFAKSQTKITDRPRVADQQFRAARQDGDEALRDFTTHRSLLEENMLGSLADEGRADKLWDGMLRELREKAGSINYGMAC